MAGAAGLGPPKGPRDGVLSAPASARCTQPTPRTPAGQGALEPGGAWWFDERGSFDMKDPLNLLLT